jgi:hypothetical protein
MDEEKPGSVIFVAQDDPGDSDWPDPVRTHVWEGTISSLRVELDAYIGQLEPGQPVVIQTDPQRPIDLAAYAQALEQVSHAGRDVVVQIKS